MKFEKRGDSAQEPSTPSSESTPTAEPKTRSKKPVIIYIMIMFIVAFLLMALSFLMHQRSNTEALGELQDSVNAIQVVQQTQEKVIELQEELAQSQDYIDKLTEDVEKLQETLDQTTAENQALTHLYLLQQSYANQDYEASKALITEMESKGMVEQLPQESLNNATSPYDRFAQLKEAVLSK